MNPHGSNPDAGDETPIEFPQANIAAMRVIATTLGSTLGPFPRDKLLVAEQADDSDTTPGTRTSGDVAVASDGATILERLPIEHPIGPILRRMVGPERAGATGVEGEAMPDGITTRATLAGALLKDAETLLDQGLHPQTIIAGYEFARDVATEHLSEVAIVFEETADPEQARLATARTVMTGNVAGANSDTWAKLAVEAVDVVGDPNENTFDVRRTPDGSIDDTRFVRGAILDRTSRVSDEMPRQVDDASVLVLDGHDRGGLQDRDPQHDVSLTVDTPQDVRGFTEAEADHKAAVVESFVNAGVDVVVTRLGIDGEYRRLLADAGIVGIRSVVPLDLTRLAKATGAHPVLDPTDVTADELGRAGTVTEVSVGAHPTRQSQRDVVIFDECPSPESVSVLLRGVSGQVADQAAMAVRKAAFAVGLADGRTRSPAGVVPGGGAVHLQTAEAVTDATGGVADRRHLALEAYADSLERVVATLVRNGGLDPLDIVPEIRATQHAGIETAGIVFPEGEVADCLEAGILDPVATVHDAYQYATAVAILLLRIDDAIDSVTTQEPTTDTDDVIYDEPAERQRETLEDRD